MATTFRSSATHERRPLGVWLLTIFDALVAGVVPVLTAFAAMGGSFPLPGGEAMALLLAGLGVGVIGAAIGTWQRSNRARIVLLALITVFYALNIGGNAVVATADYVPDTAQNKAWANAIRGVFWVALNYWYWLRPATRAWFR
jgi:hypothetical protein